MDELGQFVGRGYVAEVFEYGEGRVVKLFIEEGSEKEAELEARVTCAALDCGIAVPRIRDVVKVDDRPGIVMERIEGESMLNWGTAFPWRIYTGAKMMAQIHADMHSRSSAEMPDLRDKLKTGVESAVDVADRIRERALEMLGGLPDGSSICHGDFHPDNVMMSKPGPVIIDWQDGALGHPAGDVARTVVLVESGVPLVGIIRKAVVGPARKIFLSVYLKEYFRITGITWEEVAPWMLPVAVNYLHSIFPEQMPDQLAYTQRFV